MVGFRAIRKLAICSLAALAVWQARSAAAQFNFDTGNSGIEVIIPAVIPALAQTTSLNDAPIILRHTTMITNAWFDAISPYHPTAIGVYSRLGRRPEAEAATNRNKNIAMLYATYRVLNRLMPRFAGNWRTMMESVGLNPDDTSTDLSAPVGIGNHAGNAVAAAREQDGMNQLGAEGGKRYNLRPYEDYTGYQPVNTPYELRDPSRWPGKGTVTDLPGSEWRSYLNTGNHPEYPSGSACFCAAHSQASRRYLGSDAFGWSVTVPAGSSVIEPGVTPATDITLGPWMTFTEFEDDCQSSRLWGGVHFRSALTAGQQLCKPIGDLAFEFVDRHIRGTGR